MTKKIFLTVFALSIIASIAGLIMWNKGNDASPEAIMQYATCFDRIEDRDINSSPSLVAFDPQGRLWVLESLGWTEGKLIVYENRVETARYTEEDIPWLATIVNHTDEIVFDKNGKVWISNDEVGLTTFDGSTWTIMDTSSGLPTNWITHMEVDHQGRLWAAFYKQGLGVYEQEKWIFYTAENSGLAVNAISDIAFDDQDRALLTLEGGGYNLFDGEQWQLLNGENSEASTNFTDMIRYIDQGQAWFETSRGISIFDDENGSWLHYSINHDYHSRIFFDAAGRLWAKDGKEMLVFDGTTWKYYFEPNSPLGNPRISDPQGNLLMMKDDQICIVSADYNFPLQSAREAMLKVFVESGGIFVFSIIFILMWLAAYFDAWLIMVIIALTGIPAYYMMVSSGDTPANAEFFSRFYVWNWGVLLSFLIFVGGMLGKWTTKRSSKNTQRIGIIIGLVVGVLFACACGVLMVLVAPK